MLGVSVFGCVCMFGTVLTDIFSIKIEPSSFFYGLDLIKQICIDSIASYLWFSWPFVPTNCEIILPKNYS